MTTQESVYAIASGKGGVGKTTTTVNLGTALAGAGNRVAIVDVDLGMANLAGFVSLSPDSVTLHEVLAGEAAVMDATYQLADGIWAVPSGNELDSYAGVKTENLRDVVTTLREEFDYVLLDVGAGVSHETVLPLGLADAIIVVSTPEPAALQNATKTCELADRAGGTLAGLVLTRTRPGSDIDHEEIADGLDLPLLVTVPEDDAVRQSVFAGTPLVVHSPRSRASRAYRYLAARLVGEASADERPRFEAPKRQQPRPDTDGGEVPDEGAQAASEDDVSAAISEIDGEDDLGIRDAEADDSTNE
ncbi:cell division ATPase MinD [Haloarchaeobius sp. HME9146]|uniref:cell division ATPase MinD n=1 Tax=Haloarchaeobius sp. HME9146 TaxID=2978732 RepID=UPI0021BE9E96|nr:cell division ATPase MinD [Haloarchaeobius sp. HME9146]MCT9094607.1 cell division ATPase MinD [Haloarchaeobius sp. HME9146]